MLLTYTVSAAVLFGALTVASIYVLRRTQADRPRPYRCWGYPVTPALYLIIAVSFLVYVTQGDPHSAWKGFILILSGLPFYLIWNRKWRA
jgi:APA family basic amino acid/polyamine antiporter